MNRNSSLVGEYPAKHKHTYINVCTVYACQGIHQRGMDLDSLQ
jgi:hypothetical protein